ncbi:MAG: dihydroxyacetone kinase subunit DhaK [Eubacteriales bacterium]|nr:dihydroxyacetone kinase subunit DhaK [Christensenellaceae bacterium]MCI7768722.1 dihydroxyacetone kinase subunit DhaK [Christensenellaceae bacterium]MDY6078792.1 dihydroxyacetone kinase subunit DhaK [Eubacteriales bacterium]
MKKIMNTPETFVYDMCHGLAAAHPELEFVEKFKVVKKKEINRNKVTLISGGGSGHEPAHAGFVGKGMLDAAVCGDVFASPSQIQVYEAIKATASDKGTLLIIKNYSGDCMNFNNAGARAKEDDDIDVDAVFVNDDVAVTDSLYTVGRRGVAGTMFVHKIAGAAAEQGKDLKEVKRIAQKVIDNVASIGFAISSCTPPAKGTPIFELADENMEFGVGIHGEPGVATEKFVTSDELAEKMVPRIADNAVIKLKRGDEIAVIVNGFGGTPLSELYVLNNSVNKVIEREGYKVHRAIVGNYMTSLDMQGASVTFLKLDEELKALLDYPVNTPALTWGGTASEEAEAALDAVKALAKALNVTPGAVTATADAKSATGAKEAKPVKQAVYELTEKPVFAPKMNTAAFVALVDKMADVIIENEVHFCDMDSCGDGDFGMSIAKGFKQLKKDWATRDKADIGAFLTSASDIIMEYCGGASGPIWGSGFRYAGKAAAGAKELDATLLGKILVGAVNGVQTTGERSFGHGAVVGDKTLIDALVPCADEVTKAAAEGDSLVVAMEKGARAAVKGAEYTKQITARLGRAGVVGEKSIGHPDAGAYGLGVIFTELTKWVKAQK